MSFLKYIEAETTCVKIVRLFKEKQYDWFVLCSNSIPMNPEKRHSFIIPSANEVWGGI